MYSINFIDGFCYISKSNSKLDFYKWWLHWIWAGKYIECDIVEQYEAHEHEAV